ncbi:MAG TPA: FMN reductase [Terrimesophilobacter sp.]|jgi:Predicted flavoprotein|uniref:FMN reductase n=1 Tax=Terrimesophilobacter sp. TaxID=2906435 RepID=UPI002F95AF77
MTERRIAVISAGLSQPSSTRMLADRLADATARELQGKGIHATIDTVELRDHARDVTNNMLAGFPSPALAEVIERVTGADGLVAVSPIFAASYSGLFKSFFDILDPESLAEMPVVIGATGGTPRHSLALDYALRPLFAYLRADVIPTAVYASSADWGSTGEEGTLASLPERIERAGVQFARAVVASDRSSRMQDPFALDPSFNPTGGFTAS